MSWDPVPWFVGGGAQHSPEVARLLAYAATSGSEGIVVPTDLRVAPLDVPGTAVRVLAGAAFILNRAAGGGQQTYVARLPEPDQVAIAATGSGGRRSDLIVAMVEDPFMPGEPWQEPEDPTQGPYMFSRVIANVPAGTKRLQDVPGYAGASAITLARIDLPPSTGTVTAGMITDLRKVARPRRVTELRAFNLTGSTEETITGSNQVWPTGVATAWEKLEIPEWAGRAKIIVQWFGVIAPPGNSWGVVGGALGPVSFQATGWDTPNAVGNSRMVFATADDIPIPQALRGTSQDLIPRASLSGTSAPAARPRMNNGSAVIAQVEFYETAV